METWNIKGGGYDQSSGQGWAMVYGKRVDYVSDCVRQLEDGTWRATYTLANGDGVIWQQGETASQ